MTVSTTIAGTLYELLRNDILYARLRPGQRLRSEALRERYGGGVGTAREALNRLRAEGLVMQEDRRGFRVAPVSLAELVELTKTRCWVNDVAVRASIAQGDQAWEESVLLAYHRMSRFAPTCDDTTSRIALNALHRTFHSTLYAACGSRWLTAFAETLFDSAVRYQNIARAEFSDDRDYDSEHRTIMDAVIARDAISAIAALDRHFHDTADRIARNGLEFRENAAQ